MSHNQERLTGLRNLLDTRGVLKDVEKAQYLYLSDNRGGRRLFLTQKEAAEFIKGQIAKNTAALATHDINVEDN